MLALQGGQTAGGEEAGAGLMATYAELLRDPRWQKRRLEMLEAARWQCAECGAADRTLHVHHLRYRKGAKPWEYGDGELRVLCEDCHSQWHELKLSLDESLCFLSGKELSMLLGMAEASMVWNGVVGVTVRDEFHRDGMAMWGAGAHGLDPLIRNLKVGDLLTSELLDQVVNPRA